MLSKERPSVICHLPFLLSTVAESEFTSEQYIIVTTESFARVFLMSMMREYRLVEAKSLYREQDGRGFQTDSFITPLLFFLMLS